MGRSGSPVVLLCATDAGGARNIIPLLPELAKRGAVVTLVTRAAFLPSPMSAPHRLLGPEDIAGKTESTFAAAAPDAVVCGTTRHASPDREFLACARRSGTRSVAVVDDWYNYRYRFALNGGMPTQYPDVIALPDSQAVGEAVAEGLPAARCHDTGSPSLSELWEQGQRWLKSPPPVPSVLTGAQHPVITFISETHALEYGDAPGKSGPMGPFLGYTEVTARDQLLDALAQLPGKFVLVDKVHPAATNTARPRALPANLEYRLAAGASTSDLCFHSDAVVGMRSMALLEACLLGCRVASWQPGLLGPEQCTAVRLGLAPGLRNGERLRTWIGETLSDKKTVTAMERPAFARTDAAERVVQLALSIKAA